MFDGFWQLANDAGITVVLHAGDGGVSSNGYAVDGFAATFKGGGYKPSIKIVRHRAGHRRLPADHGAREPPRAASRTCASPSVENGAEFLPDLFRKLALDGPQDARATSPTTRSTSSASTSGSTRSGRTTSTRSSSSWAPTGCSSDRTGPTSRRCPSPLDYLRELKDLDAADRTPHPPRQRGRAHRRRRPDAERRAPGPIGDLPQAGGHLGQQLVGRQRRGEEVALGPVAAEDAAAPRAAPRSRRRPRRPMRPRLWASSMVARTMAVSCSSMPSPAMSDRSIFTKSSGKRLR